MPAPFIPSGLPRRRCDCRYPVQVPYSILLDASAATAQYLSRAYSTAATVTIFAAVKRGKLGVVSPILGSTLYFDASDHLVAFGATTAEYFRDPSAWYLIEAGPSGLRVNGETLAASLATAAVVNKQIGYDGSNRFDGYLAEVAIVDGIDAVGQFVAPRGQAAVYTGYSGSHGAAGTHLEFGNAAALGADSAGCGNWTVNGAPEQAQDSPTNNYAVVNQAAYSADRQVYGGGLRLSAATGSWSGLASQLLPDTGRWFFEGQLIAGASSGLSIGIVEAVSLEINLGDYSTANLDTIDSDSVYMEVDSSSIYRKVGATRATIIASGLGLNTVGNVFSVAVDVAEALVQFYLNGAAVGSPVSIAGLGAAGWLMFADGHNYRTFRLNFGQRPWAYDPPAGYLPLCTANLGCDGAALAGDYVGNGLANGPMIYTGCELDSATISGTTYYNDGSARGAVDFLADGFKLRSITNNTSGTTYTWTGVRRAPQKCACAVVN